MLKHLKIRLIALLAGLLLPYPTVAKPIPLEHFARLPAISEVEISPDGNRLAYLTEKDGVALLISVDLQAKKKYSLVYFDDTDRQIYWFHWGNNDRIIIDVCSHKEARQFKWHECVLLAVNFDGSQLGRILKPKAQRGTIAVWSPGQKTEGEELNPSRQDNVIHWLPDDPEHILVSVAYEKQNTPSVYRLNIHKDTRSEIVKPLLNVVDWIADHEQKQFIGIGYSKFGAGSGILTIYSKDIAESEIRKLWEYDLLDESVLQPYPLGFDRNPKKLFISQAHDGREAIFSVDLNDKYLKPTLVASDPKYSIYGQLIRSPRTGNYVGVYFDGESGRSLFWDKEFKALQAGIDKAMPGGRNEIVSLSQDETRYVLYHSGPNTPPHYFLGDRKRQSLDLIGAAFPELSNEPLPKKSLISFKARDGLELEGYLTLPLNSPGENLPTVILPHGGPSSRDTEEFDAWAAFLASRGFAVLQINFRGSIGYGASFANSRRQNWGKELQDDLTDGAQWAIKQKITNPERICIVGGSYGGYAAMMGLVKSPDVFRCAVSFAGISDLRLEVNPRSSRIIKDYFGTDTKLLNETSPLRQIEKIKSPLLLLHGDEDRIVDIEHSDKMAEALEKAGKKFKYIRLEGGDHHLSLHKHRLIFFKELEKFLEKNL